MKNLSAKSILDIFYQSAQEGIPSHWCVQFVTKDHGFAQYEYFKNRDDALKFAIANGYTGD